jgi:hypothetical protein
VISAHVGWGRGRGRNVGGGGVKSPTLIVVSAFKFFLVNIYLYKSFEINTFKYINILITVAEVTGQIKVKKTFFLILVLCDKHLFGGSTILFAYFSLRLGWLYIFCMCAEIWREFPPLHTE